MAAIHNRLSIFICLTFLLSISGFAQKQTASIIKQIKQQEQAMLDAVARGEKALWQMYLHEDCLIATEDGSTITAKKMIEELRPLPKGYVGRINIIEHHAQQLDKTIVTHFIADEYLDFYNQHIHTQYRQTNTWVQHRKAWKLIAMQTFEIPKNPKPIAVDTTILKKYEGIYSLNDERKCTVFIDNGKLFAKKRKAEPIELLAQTENLFFRNGDGRVDVIFNKNESGNYQMIERREGEDLVWKIEVNENNSLSIKPDTTAKRFLPGIVCSDSLDFNSAFSLDGKTFYFSRSRKGKYVILETHFKNGSWTSPQLSPFANPAYSNADAFVAKDGSIFYMSNMPKNSEDKSTDYDIWLVRPQNNGWSKPEFLEMVNSDSTEYYVSVADNGNLYFASDRAGGIGEMDIYVSEYSKNGYSTPKNVGSNINTKFTEHDPLIAPDESYIIYTALQRPDGLGEADLYFSKRNNEWSPSKNMGNKVNTKTYEYCPNFSLDGKYLFFSSEFDVKWMRLDEIYKEFMKL